MSIKTLEALNKNSRFDRYTATNIIFYYNHAPPEEILDYIDDYMLLPYNELSSYGFSDEPGTPNPDIYIKRLMAQVERAIRFYETHELSLYKTLIDFFKTYDMTTYEHYQLYILRLEMHLLFRRFDRLQSADAKGSIRNNIDKIYKDYVAWFRLIDSILLGRNIDSDEVMPNMEFEELLGDKMKEYSNKANNAYPYTKVDPPYSNKNQMDALHTYLKTEFEKNKSMHIYSVFLKFSSVQHTIIREHVGAMVYAYILKEMARNAKRASPAKRKVWISETIRAFMPPKMGMLDDRNNHTIYQDMDVNHIRMQHNNRNMNEEDWVEWFNNMVKSKVSIYNSKEWHEIIEMGRELYGEDPIDGMQKEYDKYKILRKEKALKGRTPLEVHGIIHNPTGPINVTIYGEDHSKIDNTFYKKHSFDERKNISVWVEHSIKTCELKEGEDKLFENAKGSEWVWFNRVKRGLQVECIDNRHYIGLPDAITENVLKYIAGLPISNNPMVEAITQRIISENNFEDFDVVNKMFIKPILAIFNKYKNITTSPLYDLYMKIMKKQHATLMHMIKNKLPHVYINVDQTIETLYIIEFRNLIKNIINMSSMMVDLHIINLLRAYKGTKPIVIFVGINHAFHIADFLGWKVRPNDTFDWNAYEDYSYETSEPIVGHKGEIIEEREGSFAESEIVPQNIPQNEPVIQFNTNNKSHNKSHKKSQNRNKQMNKSYKMSQRVQQRSHMSQKAYKSHKSYTHKYGRK